MSEEGFAPSTVYNYRRALAQILDQAVDDSLLVTNPRRKSRRLRCGHGFSCFSLMRSSGSLLTSAANSVRQAR